MYIALFDLFVHSQVVVYHYRIRNSVCSPALVVKTEGQTMQCNTFHCLTFINCHKIEIDYFRKSSYSHVSPTPVEVNDDATVTSNNGNNPNSINATEQAATNISSSSQTRRNSQVNMRLLN